MGFNPRMTGVENLSRVPQDIQDKAAEFAPKIKMGSIIEVYDGWRAQVVDHGEVVYIIEPEVKPPPAAMADGLLKMSKDKAPQKPSKYRRLFLRRRNGFVKIITAGNDLYLLPGGSLRL